VELSQANSYRLPVKKKVLIAVGQRIRARREEKGLSQEGMAELADLDRAYYGGVERGERNVAALNLVKIAVALKAEVGDLFPPLSALRKAADER
jgi:transcriptional regulator with XRE-family HTH domain